MFCDLFRSSWRAQEELFSDEQVGPHMLQCATPILAFGRWQTARVVTAGLNPSEREFLDLDRNELPRDARRFLHRSAARGGPSQEEVEGADRLAQAYFERGYAFTQWFRGFDPLFAELGCGYEDGTACHTDYASPYATTRGIGTVPGAARAALLRDGLPRWRAMLELMTECRVVVGIGAGWRVIPEALGFNDWAPLPSPLDAKGGGARGPRPHLLRGECSLNGRTLDLFWWRPNRGDPLSYLSARDKAEVALMILRCVRL